MSKMKHGISDQEWNDYLDGSAAAEMRDRIEAHLTSCMSCWEFYEQMSCTTQALYESAEEARRQLTLEDPQLHRMLRGTFARLRAPDSSQSLVQGRLNTLETVLAPFCGTDAAVRALHAAARHSPARSLEQVTHDNWGPFLERLTTIAGAMCGETFASLVWERGQL